MGPPSSIDVVGAMLLLRDVRLSLAEAKSR
jgi:hypothetical protein